MNKLQRLELIKDMVQQAIDRGATSAEQIHQYIADLPFEALEQSGLIEGDPMQLRETKRRTIGVVYEAIRRINSEVGTFISEQIENLEDGQAVANTLGSADAHRPARRSRRGS